MRTAIRGITVILFLLPLIAMRFTDEVDWGLGDFLLFGALLAGVNVAYDFLARRGSGLTYKTAAAVALAAAFLLVWLGLGVGIIGRDGDPANGMYFGVIAAGAIGAVAGRFRPRGMARAMLLAALVQVLVAVIALLAGFGGETAHHPFDILLLTAIFTALWILSARLFRRAANTT